MSSAVPHAATAPTSDRTELTAETRVRFTAREVIAGVVAIITVTVALAGSYWTMVTHSTSAAVHLSPSVQYEGGVVTKRQLRKVLRTMTIRCESGGSTGFTCHVEVPEEAE